MKDWPLLLETNQLLQSLQDPELLIVDVCSGDSYSRHHIPGAVHISPSELQRGDKPAPGKLPAIDTLQALFRRIGLTPERQVVCYDDEGGGWAGRLIWTLDAIGHHRYTYLNGGLPAWLGDVLPVTADPAIVAPSDLHISLDSHVIAEGDEIMAGLSDPQQIIWDARSAEEYRGEKVLAARGGHIPGAVNLDWLELMDRDHHLRLKDLDDLQARLSALGITPDKTVITHCQTHHRSGLSYLLMRLLGYPNIKGYHGSWGEWGNREDTPVVTGSTPAGD